jgi:hypothetical protein
MTGARLGSVTGKEHVERGSLLPLSRRELAPGMVGKKRFASIRRGYRQAIASKLA